MDNRLNVLYEKKPCYDIVFSTDFDGLLEELEAQNIKVRKVCVVTDSHVSSLYGEEIMGILEGHCKKNVLFSFPAGEESKTLSTVKDIYTFLIKEKFDTEYVLLDEPTNNLDIYHASNMMKIVRRLCDELGKTVILVLHEINYAAFYSDYICAFAGGKIVKMGTVEEVMTKENLAEIAPVLRLTTVSDEGLVEAIRANAQTVGAIFGETEHVDELLAQYDAQIAALAEFAQGKTCVLGMSTSGSFNLLGNDGRCSLIVNEIGFDNIGVDAAAAGSDSGRSGGHGSRDEGNEEESSGRSGSGEGSEGEGSGRSGGHGSGESGNDASGSAGVTPTHGNEVSFEAIVALNPDYIFVMDRDSAISATGAQLAQEIMENELVMKTDAYRNGNLVILENPGIWYLAEGGIPHSSSLLVK